MVRHPQKILVVYWGRRGLNALVHEILGAFGRRGDTDYLVSLSRHNSDLPAFAVLGGRIVLADIFQRSPGALNLARLRALRRSVAALVREQGITDVVTLMPHVWSFAVSSAFREGGARYHTVIHDAIRHPGDGTGVVLPLLLRDALTADTVFTLSEGVAAELQRRQGIEASRLKVLFHPATGPANLAPVAPPAGEPWRFLFLGRIMPYKGLPLFVDMVSRLRAEGRAVEATVMGEGGLGSNEAALAALGAKVVNRWVSDAEIASALREHHALVLSHIEASQSGVAATALGAGLPVIATPVGGLKEQVRDRTTGLLAREANAAALAEAAREMMDVPGLHSRLASGAAAACATTSGDAFVEALLSALARGPDHASAARSRA
ncbi:glycosyltransferase family 4 protein [Salinarimonas soli]|uniref:Glycosyltransferase family 4 protein n=1 Tax=Salinarimonas soli TaxID=1638099 RepID=A0A5B2V8U8_9HYPH|nr:glycosyltransferase family 4 protein [Salinarimonas soli]KAA2235236.1 glycosyltransferase family 4 protein [Salinarimonas soli]